MFYILNKKITAEKDPLVFLFKIPILNLKSTYQKDVIIDDVIGYPRNHVSSPYNGNNYYIR